MFQFIASSGLVLAACILATGCDSKGYGTSPSDSYPYASIPTPGTVSVTLSSASQVIPLPSTADYGGTITLPAAATGAGTRVALYTGIAPPFGPGTPVLAPTSINDAPAPIPLIYLTFTPASATTLATLPGFAITLPANISSGATFYLGAYDPAAPLSGYILGTEGPASVSGSALTFTPPPRSGPTWNAQQTYAYVLYAIPTPAPTPSPIPHA